jgi:Ca2+-transporting ATPase
MPNDTAERQPLLNGAASNRQQLHGFGIDATTLTELMDPKNPQLLRDLGGVKGVCAKLKVDPTQGLSVDEDKDRSTSKAFQAREQVFGRNVLPEATSKSFLQLLWAAYNDKTLSKYKIERAGQIQRTYLLIFFFISYADHCFTCVLGHWYMGRLFTLT